MNQLGESERREKRSYGKGRVFYREDRGAWFIDYYVNGKKVRERIDGDQDDATRTLRRRLKEKEKDSFVAPSEKRVTVGQLLDARLNDLATRGKKSLRFDASGEPCGPAASQIALVRKHFDTDKAVEVTAQRLERFIAEEQKLGRKPATINRYLQELRAAYRLAVKQKRLPLVAVPYFPLLSERGNVRRGFFEVNEFEAVAAKLPAHIGDFARFGYFTGWRRSEIAGLTWDQIDHAAHEVRLYDSKNGEGRTVALPDDLWELIERRWTARSWTDRKTKQTHVSNLVFHRKGRPVQSFYKAWTAALEDAGLPTGKGVRKLFHDLRRTAVRDMVRANVPQSVAMSVSGHKTVSMFLRYKITSGDEQRDALARTAALRKQRASETDTERKVVALPRP